jgi:hypothetical protein
VLTCYTMRLALQDPELSKVFAPNGELLTPGSITRRPTYAQTLEKIASKGADAFYEGEIAEGIVRAVQKAGGVMQLEDLKSTVPLSFGSSRFSDRLPFESFEQTTKYTVGPCSRSATGTRPSTLLKRLHPARCCSRRSTPYPATRSRRLSLITFQPIASSKLSRCVFRPSFIPSPFLEADRLLLPRALARCLTANELSSATPSSSPISPISNTPSSCPPLEPPSALASPTRRRESCVLS